jgi:hypothetical protein
MRIGRLFIIISVCILFLQAHACFAGTGLLSGFFAGEVVKETYVGARLGSYRPDLSQLDAILQQFRVSAPGAATMFNIFAKFKGSSQLSYLVEAGYWDNEASLEPVVSAELGMTLTQLSLSFLYYPEMIQEFIPLYLGIGGGVYHLKLDGSAMELLKTVITKREDTGAGANFVVGLEYEIRESLMVNIQANHVFKNFAVDEDGEQEFSFDGTVISIGAFARF